MVTTRSTRPFPVNTTVRLKHCDDPDCRCRGLSHYAGDMGKVVEYRGNVLIVDFPSEGMMQWEVGFRIDTAKDHLEAVLTR